MPPTSSSPPCVSAEVWRNARKHAANPHNPLPRTRGSSLVLMVYFCTFDVTTFVSGEDASRPDVHEVDGSCSCTAPPSSFLLATATATAVGRRMTRQASSSTRTAAIDDLMFLFLRFGTMLCPVSPWLAFPCRPLPPAARASPWPLRNATTKE